MVDLIQNALAHVAAIPPYPPGRPVDAVAREFGLDPQTIVKLASNENPLGCSPRAQLALRELARTPNIYPDFDNYDLRHAIARHTGFAADQVLPGAGSSEIILLAVRALLDRTRNAIIPQYSFQSYEGAVRSVDSEAIIVPARDYAVDLDAVLAAVTPDTKLVFLATPNNPTGLIVGRDDLDRFVDALPADVLFILDEAYREFVPEKEQPDVKALLDRRRNMLVMRTFSKLHGLAGLRAGYALGDPELLQLLRRLQLPFSVSSAAQVAAIASLEDDEFAELSRATNEAERQRLQLAFDRRSITYLPSQGNFILAKVGDGAQVTRELMARGVIVRPVANYGLPEWLRVTVGVTHENDKFIARLDEVMAESLHPASN